MSATFDKLKDLLKQQGTLSDADIEAAVSADGDLSDEERMWLEAEKLEIARDRSEAITMDQYLAALRILDNAAAGSEEYTKAEKVVDTYEKGG